MAVSRSVSVDKLKPFHFHGLETNNDSRQAIGDCPFCHAGGKFGVHVETGKYRCVRCEETGNIYTFLARIYTESLQSTDSSDYESLADARRLAASDLRDWGLAKSILSGEWIIPSWKPRPADQEGTDQDKVLPNGTRLVLTNLYRVVPLDGSNKYRVMSTPECKLGPFGFDLYAQSPATTVRICEGLWDGIAMYSALRTHRKGKGDQLIKTADVTSSLYNQYSVFTVPGAGNFNAEWFQYLAGKNIELLYDNDHPRKYPADHEKAGELMVVRGKHVRPGWDGMQRVVELANVASKRPKSLALINWANVESETISKHPTPGHHPQLPDGYDIRDLFSSPSPLAGLRLLPSLLEPVKLLPPKNKGGEADATKGPVIEPVHRATFEELCADYAATLHFTQHLRDTLSVMLAIVVSTDLTTDVDHIWLRVIGPPGSGKSTLAEAVSAAREWVAPKSTLTGFHSGFVDYDQVTGEKKEDASLLHELNGKTVIMKDADTLANSPSRDRILSELRDLYDGSSRAHYRNKVKSDFENIRLTFILCGTDALRTLNKTFLGERFLDCEIIRNEDTTPYLQRASASAYASLAGSLNRANNQTNGEAEYVNNKLLLKQATFGFIKHLKESIGQRSAPLIKTNTLTTLENLARYVAMLRARKPDATDLNFRPRTELPTRLTNQLTKLAFSLALVLGKDEADDEVMRIVLKVVQDTSLGFQQEVIGVLCKQPVSVRTIAMEINQPETTIRRLLFDMMDFGIVQRYSSPNNTGQRGRDSHLWELSPVMAGLYYTAHPDKLLDTTPKSTTKASRYANTSTVQTEATSNRPTKKGSRSAGNPKPATKSQPRKR